MLKSDGEWDDRVDIFWFGFDAFRWRGCAYGYYIDKCVKKLESLDIEVSSDSYKKKMVEYAHKSLDPIRATWQYFAPTEPRPLWTNEGVSLYPETIDALEKLS